MGWFNGAGEYTGRYISNATFKEYARQTAAAAAAGGTGTAGSGYTAGELSAGQTAYDALRTTTTVAGTAVAVQTAKAQQLSLMAQVKSWGTLKTIGNIGLALTAFDVGWKIGSEIGNLLFGDTTAPSAEKTSGWRATTYSPYSPGELLPQGSEGNGATAPGAGWVVLWKNISTGSSNVSTLRAPEEQANCTVKAGSTVYDVPAGATMVKVGKELCKSSPAAYADQFVYWVPLQVSELPPGGHTTTSPVGTKTTAEPGTQMTATQATEAAEKCLESKTCEGVAGHYFHTLPGIADAVSVEPGYPADATIPQPGKITVPAPQADETYDLYLDRLAELGLVGQAQELAETAIDTSKGPLVVTQVIPDAGSQVAPGSPVRVRYNPENAPEAVLPPSEGSCDATVDQVDFSPLSVPVGDKFPFGIFVFFVDWVGTWSTTVTAPVFDLPLAGDLEIHVDLGVMEPVMEPVRLAIVFASFVGLLWFLGTAALRLTGDSS